MQCTKHDWKLFRERIGNWQERYMGILNKEYIEILQSDKPPSEKFWELEKRIKKDRKSRGVLIELSRDMVPFDVLAFYKEGIISEEELNEFSPDLKAFVLEMSGRKF